MPKGSALPDARQSNAAAIWALGITQIIGYGTLYYSFSILAPSIAAEFEIGVEFIYGFMSVALLAGGMIAPYSGALADRHGAARVLSFGSISAAIALAICGLANNAWLFLGGVILIELASAFVLYATAFALLAQATGSKAQRSITYLTLIAGFASTVFWPLTTWLLRVMDWHQIYFLFAGMNLFVCLPLHLWLTRFTRTAATRPSATIAVESVPIAGGNFIFLLVVVGFSLAGFVSAAILFHVVPMLGMLGLGASGVFVATLFGPAQVASRLINMVFGQDLPAPILAVISAMMMPIAMVVLALSAPSVPGAMAFAIVFGLGSGLFSIVSGTLPLALFGKAGYGKRLGWISMGRLCLSAMAPFALSVSLGWMGPKPSLWALAGAGIICVGVFAEIWRRSRSVSASIAGRQPA
jgi:MFS family permease